MDVINFNTVSSVQPENNAARGTCRQFPFGRSFGHIAPFSIWLSTRLDGCSLSKYFFSFPNHENRSKRTYSVGLRRIHSIPIWTVCRHETVGQRTTVCVFHHLQIGICVTLLLVRKSGRYESRQPVEELELRLGNGTSSKEYWRHVQTHLSIETNLGIVSSGRRVRNYVDFFWLWFATS